MLNYSRIVRFGVLFPVLICFAACGSGLKQVRSDLKRLERSQGDIRARQADQTSAISALQDGLRRLSGRLEELEYLQRSRVGTDITSLKRDISSLQRRVPPPAIVPGLLLESDEVLAKKLPPSLSSLFMEILSQLRTGAYREALSNVEKALSFSYGGEGTPELMFWKGVSYDGLGENRKAISAYSELVGEYPKHDRTAVGLLRLASVFIRIGDTRTAKLTFQKLIADFPKSSAAAQAKERLKDV
jgi:TolA-binding protein